MSSAANPSIAGALRALRERLTTAARAAQLHRPPVLVAVSKTKPASAVQEAYDSEQRHFGENYVVELLEKAPQLPGDVRWHFIGHLQSNKAKALAALPNLHLVESVDNEKLATALNKACAGRAERLRVLIQVNTSNEASKTGCTAADAPSLFAFVARSCDRLLPCGLMTIGRLAPTPQPDCFEALVAGQAVRAGAAEEGGLGCAGAVRDEHGHVGRLGGGTGSTGSSIVRVGSGIFGERDYGAPAAKDANAQQTDGHASAAQ